MFFDDGKDKAVADAKSYHKTNLSCSDLNLSSPTIDTKTFVKLVDCFNSGGAIDPVARLVHRLEKDDPAGLDALVALLNKHALSDGALLYKLDETFKALEAAGRLDSVLSRMGAFIENDELVASFIALLHESYSGGGVPRKLIIRSLERVSSVVTPENAAKVLDGTLTVVSARAFDSLKQKFAGKSPVGRDGREMVRLAHAYLSDRDPKHVPVLRHLVSEIGSRRMFAIMDSLFGKNSAEIGDPARGVPWMTSVFKIVFRRGPENRDNPSNLVDSAIMSGICSLYHMLHRPLVCFDGGASVADMDLNMIRELSTWEPGRSAEFYRWSNLLMMAVTNPFCSYPPGLGKKYEAMLRLSDTHGIEPSSEVVSAFFKQGLAGVLVDMISDTGIRQVFPALAEFTDRRGWDDFFFLVTAPGEKTRDALARALRFVSGPAFKDADGALADGANAKAALPPLDSARWPYGQRPGTNDIVRASGLLGIYDVFEGAVLHSGDARLFRLLAAVKAIIEKDRTVLRPALEAFRTIHYINNVYPFIDLARSVMASAAENEQYFEALFRMAGMKEFGESVVLAAAMAQDGRMKEFMNAVLALFRKFASQGREGAAARTAEPRFVPDLRHDFAAPDFKLPDYAEPAWDSSDPCRKLDLDVFFHQYKGEQLSNYLACLGSRSGAEFGDAIREIEMLRKNGTSDGVPYYDVLLGFVSSMRIGAPAMRDLSKRFLSWADDGRLYRLLDLVPAVASGRAGDGTVVEALSDVLRKLLERARGPLRRLLDAAAIAVKEPAAPEALKFARAVIEKTGSGISGDSSAARLPPLVPDIKTREELARLAGEHEKAPDVPVRVAEITDEFNEALNNWELVDGKPRRAWEYRELRTAFEPVVRKLAESARGDGGKSVRRALLNVMEYFDLRPEDATLLRPSLYKWLMDRAVDFKPILYYYPGDRRPRARLVNSLDRFEILLLNADFSFITRSNVGLDFLAMIGGAWGDEPREFWPVEIRRKFPEGSGRRPMTLAEASAKIEKVLRLSRKFAGFPGSMKLPVSRRLKERIFNMAQVFPVITENLPDSGHANAFGLKVLRKLFYELHTSSPAGRSRSASAGRKNNLSVVTAMVRLGLMRQVGRLVMRFDPVRHPEQSAALVDFFEGLADAAQSKGAARLLDAVFSNMDGRDDLVWKALKALYDLVDLGPEMSLRLKNAGFYGIAALGGIDAGGELAGAAADAIAADRAYVSSRIGIIKNLFGDYRIDEVARSLFAASVGMPEERQGFIKVVRSLLAHEGIGADAVRVLSAVDDSGAGPGLLFERMKALRNDGVFRNLEAARMASDVADFFEEDGAAARSVRVFLGARLSSRGGGSGPGDVERILEMMADRKFPAALGVLGKYIHNGRLPEILRYGVRGLGR
ncbi:MAG: hypothetical protein A2583_05515 [Bdellovibrionales bacterium RIFOXYD1_FULL_53_11]|nr:MAG: hypothetical protein A2583_05515 [Bdellovibrionales bacterium RIFOXYD1_FULL_53_11]